MYEPDVRRDGGYDGTERELGSEMAEDRYVSPCRYVALPRLTRLGCLADKKMRGIYAVRVTGRPPVDVIEAIEARGGVYRPRDTVED